MRMLEVPSAEVTWKPLASMVSTGLSSSLTRPVRESSAKGVALSWVVRREASGASSLLTKEACRASFSEKFAWGAAHPVMASPANIRDVATWVGVVWFMA